MDKGYKIITVSVAALKYTNIIDIEGDEISYENLTNSITTFGVMIPILIDSEDNIISGNRRVLVSKDLIIETIPAIVVNSNITEDEINQMRSDFLLTQRNLSYLDVIQIHYYQDSVFHKFREPYSEYTAKLMDCTQRQIQLKIKAGKMYSTLPIEVKKIFQSLDSVKKIPLKTFKVMSSLQHIDLDNFIKDVESEDSLQHQHLVSITNEYQQMLNRIKRNKKINEDAKKSKKKKEDAISSSLEPKAEEKAQSFNEPLKELNSSNDVLKKLTPPQSNSFKTVLHYEIKKYFNLSLDKNEQKNAKVANVEFNFDFSDTIELISSIFDVEEVA